MRKIPAPAERRKKPTAQPLIPIRIGMQVRILRDCGVPRCRWHEWHRWFYRGTVIQKRGSLYLVDCIRGMGQHWVSRDFMFIRGHDRRGYSVPLGNPPDGYDGM